MSSDFVFEYDGTSYPNIHSKPEHYIGGTLTPYAQTTNKMAAIKTRYLNMMKAQLAGQQTDAKKKAFIEGMELAKFEKMEKQIENKIVEEYNKAASKLGGNIGGYNMGVDGYVAALKSGDKDGAIKSLAQIIAVFHQNKDAVALYEMLKDNPQQIYSDISINELINVQAFMKVIEAAMNGENYRNTLNSILTKPSEALAALIGTYAEAKSDTEVKDLLLGTQSQNIRVSFSGEFKEIQSKSADISLGNSYFSYNIGGSQGSQGVELYDTFDVETFATVKTYRTAGGLSLTSYSGKNSFLIPALHQLYGGGNSIDYQIYNTLAFSAGQESGALDTNFRIIRQDLIAKFAENFLIGFNTAEAQRVLVYNFRAYPVLTILADIVNDAKNAVREGNLYGSLSSGDLFSISLTKSAVDNSWVGQKDITNKANKAVRVKRAYNQINSIAMQGHISGRYVSSNLRKYLTAANGIPI